MRLLSDEDIFGAPPAQPTAPAQPTQQPQQPRGLLSDDDIFGDTPAAPPTPSRAPAPARETQPGDRLRDLVRDVDPWPMFEEKIRRRDEGQPGTPQDYTQRTDERLGQFDPIPGRVEVVDQSVRQALERIVDLDQRLSGDLDEETAGNFQTLRRRQVSELRTLAERPVLTAEQAANISSIADFIERGASPATILQNIDQAGIQDEGGRTPLGWLGAIPRLAASGLIGVGGASVEGTGLIAENLGFEGVGRTLRDAGRATQEFVQENVEPDARYGEGAIPDIIRGTGSMAGFIGAGLPTAFLTRTWGTVPRAVATGGTAASLAGPAGAAEAYQRAIQFGLDEQEAVEVSLYGIPAGVVQVAPVAYILRAIPAEVRGRALGQIRHVAEAAVGEFGAEGAGAIVQNFVEQSYNPDRGLWDDVLYQALIGAAAGGISTAGLQALTRGEGVAPTEPRLDPETGLPEGAAPAEQLLGEDPEVTPAPTVPQPSTPPSLRDWLDDSRTADQITADAEAQQRERERMLEDLQRAVQEGEAERARRGTRGTPVEIDGPEAVSENAHITEQPTPAQAEAGNYRKRHVRWQGFDISIETEAGQERTGVAPDGTPWSVTMPAPYGEIKRTRGADGDPLDVYIGPSNVPSVFVVDQIDPATARFDEHKAMLGFDDADQAAATYAQAFDDDSGPERMGAMTPMTVAQFRQWVRNGNTRKPVTYQPPPRDRSPRRPQSLLEFIASRGGLRPHPDLDFIGIRNQDVRGFGRLIREDGMELDRAREAAAEAGYFMGDAETDVARSTNAQLLDMIDAEARRGRTATMRPEDRMAAEQRAQRRLENDPAYREHVANQQFLTALEEIGLTEANVDPDTADRARQLIMEGNDPLDALEQAQMEQIALDEEIAARVREEVPEFEYEIPFDAEDLAGMPESGEPGAQPIAQEEAAPVGEDDSGARPGEGEALVEPGAEGLPQQLVPGVAPVTDGDRLAVQADRPMAPSAAQQEPGGLFGPERDQTDMFDAPPVPGVAEATAESLETPSATESEIQADMSTAADFGTPDAPDIPALGRAYAEHLAAGNRFATITQARQFAAQRLGGAVRPGTPAAKAVDEAVEFGVVLASRDIVQQARADGASDADIFDRLTDLYQRQPTLGTRTSTSMADQAYSTPVPLAFLASRLAGITPQSRVYEPSAGNGALLVEATPENVIANEINDTRAQALREQGFAVTTQDASDPAQAQALAAEQSVDVVIGNPPFGVVRDENNRTRRFRVSDRYQTNEIDHAITMTALDAMPDAGSAVLIVGSVSNQATTPDARSDAYNQKAKREFYFNLYQRYNVVDHFTVAGDLWQRQGAGFPTDVIVIRGRGQSQRRLPAAEPPEVLADWDSVKGKLDAQYGVAAAQEPDGPAGEPARPDAARGARPDDAAGDRGVRDGEPRPGRDRGADPDQRPAGVQPGPDRGQRADRAAAEPESDRVPARDERTAGTPDGRADRGVETADVAQTEAATETAAAIEGPDRSKPKPRRQPEAERERIDTSATQVRYRPKSSAKGMDTLVPVNVQTAVGDALGELAQRVGDIDAFVARELGMDADRLSEYFGAEQVDGIALAIDNFSRGAGFIVGDQTGIGKGRQVAAVLRWSMRNGKTPIFITEKPNLYADMYRDLVDVGVEQMLGRDLRILMTNSGETVPLTDDGSRVLKSKGAAAHGQLLRKLEGEGGIGDHDIVFTTYSQMQTVKQQETDRMRFLRAITRNNGVLVMDESHNAGGQKLTGRDGERDADQGMNRATFARELTTIADAVLYSSATYAKRPDVMDLYSKTDMRLAVDDPADIGELIAKGGVPMQQIVASMLSRAGQYLRRERSFDGIRYETPLVPVDRRAYESFSSSIASIQGFSEGYVKRAVKRMDKRLKEEAKRVSVDQSTGGAGASSTNFTSVMHNVINQMLLSLTADSAADQAIESLRAGEKPVITVASTLESFVDQYAEDQGISTGQPIPITMQDLLLRYLRRSREITVKPPGAQRGESERIYLSDQDLGPEGRAAFREAEKAIRAAGLDSLPVSPIDWMRKRLTEAGFSVGEITGRNLIIDYRADGEQILSQRPGAERSIKGRRETIARFNGGQIDAIILNQAGSTGLSLHASERVQDQRPRHMIIAQAEGNIDTHMQMLGRVNRTGQIVLPRYSQLVADVPATKRPAAVLAKKMASLNANTTGARSSAVTARDVPDFMNEYGDKVAASVMADNPDIHEALGAPLSEAEDGFEAAEAMRKVTGRIPLLPLSEQENLYALLESEYTALIEQMEATGQNALEAKTLDLDAKIVEQTQVRPPGAEPSPFADGVFFEKMDVRRIGKPMSSQEVLQRVREEVDAPADATQAVAESRGKEAMKAIVTAQQADFDAFSKQQVDAIEDPDRAKVAEAKFRALRGRWTAIANSVPVGQGIKLKTIEGNFYGIVTKVERTGKTKNPLALGAWKVQFALADATRQITIPFSQLYTAQVKPTNIPDSWVEIERTERVGSMPIISAFDDMQAERRETRTIVTGNILAGYDAVNGKGSIINFTDDQGRLRQGILMRRDFNPEKFLETKPVRFHSSDQVLRFIETTRGLIESTDQSITVAELPSGDIRIITDASRARGGRYFLNARVREAAGQDFVKASGKMRIDVPPTRATRVLDAMRDLGAVFETKAHLDQARRIAGEDVAMARRGDDAPVQVETVHRGPLRVEYTMREPFIESLDRLEAELRTRLDGLGLTDVGVRLVSKIRYHIDGQGFPADGTYMARIISVALDSATDQTAVLDHEALHAMRRLGFFSDREWAILSRRSEQRWMQRYNIARNYPDVSFDAQVEEGVAHAFQDWRAGNLNASGMVARLLRRIRDFIERLGNALRGLGFEGHDDIFQRAAGGRLGGPGRPAANAEMMMSRRVRTSQQRQGVMQGFIARGQPLDRMMRIPFDIFGGLDRTGAWRPGKFLFDKHGTALSGAMIGARAGAAITNPIGQAVGAGLGRFVAGRSGQLLGETAAAALGAAPGAVAGAAIGGAAGALLQARFNPNGRLGFMSQPLEIARAGLIDRYGLDQEYVTRERRRGLDERRILMQGVEILNTLKDANVGTQEARVLQSILTGEAVNDADMQRLAQPIREAIDQLGQEAVSLGLVSAESFERNRGTYLHRVYMKHENDQGALVRFVSQAMSSRRKKIIGDQFKGRGIFFDIPLARLIRDDPEWKAAKRGKPQKGEKFRLMEFVPGRFTDTLSGQEREQRATRRVWWPADRALPKRLQGEGWTDRGTWEVRGDRADNLTLWRDYTAEERRRMGEILDARYTIGRTFMLMAHDLAVGKFYRDVAANEEWTITQQPSAPWRDASEFRRTWNDPEIQWVRVPDTEIPKTGGKKRWGALSGKWVRAEIWRDLNEIDIMNKPGTWRRLLTQWKLNKTARSPVVHMNNIMSNVMFMDMANIRMQDLYAGIQSFVRKDSNYQEALENGAFGADMMSQEIRDNVLRPILDDLRRDVVNNAPNSFLNHSRLMGRIAERIWTWAKTADQKMVDAYRVEDELFRMATYMRRREFGDTPEQAATFAREQFLDYDIRAPWINAARQSVLPFISYTYRAVPLIARSMAYHPWKLPKYFLIAYMLNALAYMWDEGEDGEDRERASMREAEQGYTWVGVPRMLRMPYRDDNGLPVFIDIRRWIPAGDIFDMNQGQSAVPIPAPLQFGGPLMLGAELMLNRTAFTGQEIINEKTDDWYDVSRNVGDWAWKSWMPSAAWVPGSWYWTRIGNAASGATDWQGRPYRLPEALASSVGIKLRPQDVDEGLFWRFREFEQVERALRDQARSMGRQRERGLISEAYYNREMNRILQKMERNAAQADELAREATPAGQQERPQ